MRACSRRGRGADRSARPVWVVLALALVGAALCLAHTEEIRARAIAALGVGMPPREAELARGFVLGEDERIDSRTVEDFRRSGLAHLLAVSGQNVALLVLLAMPMLAAAGLSLRARLVWVLGLIAVYVPLAGAGPSIQRAGVMGALSVLATLAGRRPVRFHALAVAAIVLLAIDPGVAADVGWQLSFAAVLGILLLAAPLRDAIASRLGRGGAAGALADGAAMTVAATLATAPLIAFHFGGVPVATVLANLLALPAVAPAMWLGMLAAGAGQVPGAPVGWINALNAPLLAYVAQVAAWCGRPSWAYLELRLGAGGVAGSYLALALASLAALRVGRARRVARARSGRERSRRGGRRSAPRLRLAPAAAAALALAVLAAWATLRSPAGGVVGGGSPEGLRVSVLDVGQGDAILLRPAAGPAVLVDAGPPRGGLVAALRGAGVGSLGAAIVTHDQADHAGGLAELLAAVPVGRLLFAAPSRELRGIAAAAGVPTGRLVQGSALRLGELSLEALWPPAERLTGVAADPNAVSLVLLARWRGFRLLLSGDAEAEAVPLDPGPLDAIKVAHHGSEDAGLAALLARTRPRLALISVGAGNPYGHPSPATLSTLAAHGIPSLRTDLAGTIVLDVAGEPEPPRRAAVESGS